MFVLRKKLKQPQNRILLLCRIFNVLLTSKTIVPDSVPLNFIVLIFCCECEYAKFHIKFQRQEKISETEASIFYENHISTENNSISFLLLGLGFFL